MSEQSLIPFEPPREEVIEVRGDRLVAVVIPNDGAAVPIRMMCESIGLAAEDEVRRVREHPVLAQGLRMVNVTLGGRVRSVAALIHTMIPYWLAAIDPARVNDAVRDKVVLYQTEVANTLAQLYYGADAVPMPIATDPATQALQQRTADLMRELRLARDALLATQHAHAERLNTLEAIVDELQDIVPVLPQQAAYIQNAIKQLVQRAQRRKQTISYERLFAQFKADFRIPRYDALPARRYPDAVAWLEEQARALLPDDPEALPPQQERLL